MKPTLIKLEDLVKTLKGNQLTIMEDWHDFQPFIQNQCEILNLLSKNTKIGLEYPMELLALSPLIPKIQDHHRCYPLIMDINSKDIDYDTQISLFLQTYLKHFSNIFAVIGRYHVEKQVKKFKDNLKIITILQSVNGNTYPDLNKGIYLLENENKYKNFLIKGKI